MSQRSDDQAEAELAEDPTLCPIARSMAVIGDRWSPQILRELAFGTSRFDDLQTQTGATPQMLASRLKKMEAHELVQRHAYQERPLRYEYRLTQKGAAFMPVIMALRAWGEAWCKAEDEPLALLTTHRECGGSVGLDGSCFRCGETVTGLKLMASPSPEYAEERRRRASR